MKPITATSAIFNSAPKRPSRSRSVVEFVSASVAWSVRLAVSAGCLVLPLTTLLWPSGASTAPGEACHTPSGTERHDVLEGMRGSVAHDLGQPVQFKVSTIRVCGPWAFVIAEPMKPGGGTIQWERTICSGDVSHLVGALQQKDATGAWSLKEYALCPTDVAWENWPEKYGAPQALFAE